MVTTVVQVDLTQVIYSDNTRTPLIGFDSPDGEHIFAPWVWDERMWTDEYFENQERAIPVLGDQDTRGIPEEYWQSGVGSDDIDLEILKAVALREESQERWTVRVRHGDYYKFQKPRYLFSDRSQVQFIDNTDNETLGGEARNVLQLAVAPAYNPYGVQLDSESPRYGSPIKALMWTRNSLDEPVLFRFIQKRTQFTGLFDASGEQDTQDDDGDIIWSAVDTGRNEFVVQWSGDQTTPPKLYFNRDYTFLFGKSTISNEDDLVYCDFLGEGMGTEEDQILYTKHFPIMDNSELKLYKLVGSVVTEMARWDPDSPPPTPEYVIDTDRGEVTFPSEVNGVATNITPPVHGVKIYAVYRPTIEVEYEPETCNNFLTAPYVDMNPISTFTDRGFIYLTERELRVAYLELSADATLIEENIYGPLYLGSDYCFLIATLYNNHGQPVPGVEVSFWLDDTEDGWLNGALSDGESSTTYPPVTATTDQDGRARVVYSSPRSIESVGQYIAHVNGVDNQDELTLIHNNGITSEVLGSLFVYQVFNDDGMQRWYDDEVAGTGEEPGYGGRKVVLYRKVINTLPGWAVTQDYLEGNYVENSNLPYRCIDTHTAAASDEPGVGANWELYWVRDDSINLGGGIVLDSQRFPGDSEDLHPRTGEDGGTVDVWMPLRPSTLTGGGMVLGFSDNLPWTENPPADWASLTSYSTDDVIFQPDTSKWYKALSNHTSSTDDEPGVGDDWETYWVEDLNAGNLVSYWVSGGKQVSAHASCFSYLYNNTIYSNDVEFRINIPEYLTGVYVTEDDEEIPYGFRLYDDYTAASGIDGATFLSINPRAGKWPIIWDGTELGDQEDAHPFHVLGHEFEVTIP